MTMQIVDCVQGTPEWFKARLGLPTASMFDAVLASGKGGGESKTRATYMRKLAGEIITGEQMEAFTNFHMSTRKKIILLIFAAAKQKLSVFFYYSSRYALNSCHEIIDG